MSENQVASISSKKLCFQAGFLPVPLKHVPPASLAELEVYLYNSQIHNYSLYRHPDLPFGKKDYLRLQDSGVDFVYVSVRDHQAYYRTMETAIQNIVDDSDIQQEKKAEILYSTSMELANQLLEVPPGKEEIERTSRLARASVRMIMNDKKAFSGLFDVFNHDFYTATHMVNVCSSSISLGLKMGLVEPEILQSIGTGALLHDIGKIFIPIELLNSKEKITPAQKEILNSHVEKGYNHLIKVMPDLPRDVISIILEHHERIDGKGYPNGLKSDQLSSMGRLAGIVDSFEAMTSVRPYREHTFSVGDALQEIEDGTPDKYDLDILRAFASMVESAITDEQDNGGKLTLGSPEKIIAHKITCSSIAVLSPRAVQLDQNIHISSPIFNKINLTKMTAVVTRCQDHGDGWFSVEAQFHVPQSPKSIAELKNVTTVREISPLLKQ